MCFQSALDKLRSNETSLDPCPTMNRGKRGRFLSTTATCLCLSSVLDQWLGDAKTPTHELKPIHNEHISFLPCPFYCMLGAVNGTVQRFSFAFSHVDISLEIKSRCLIWGIRQSVWDPRGDFQVPLFVGERRQPLVCNSFLPRSSTARRRESQIPHLERCHFIVVVSVVSVCEWAGWGHMGINISMKTAS